VAIPIGAYIGATSSTPFTIVSDASPTGMCAVLYHPESGIVIAWAEFKFPYGRDVNAQYQGNREYLGHIFSIIVLIAYTNPTPDVREYMWVNDNTGAIQWAANQKCSSMASQYANLAATQLHIQARLRMVPPTHKPGIEMGDIDRMSRLAPHERPTDQSVLNRCPTLTRQTMITLPHTELHNLFLLLDPHLTGASNSNHHTAFITICSLLEQI
jgi:hypothetical protein